MNKFIKIVGAVAVINIVARLFGFFREMVIGYQYGSTHVADSIFTAYLLPNFLYLVVGGAFTTAVISIYNRKTTDQAQFVKQSFTIVVVSLTVMTVAIMAFTEPLMHLFEIDDKGPEAFDLAVNLFYWMMPSSILLALASWYSGMLNIHDKFHLSSFAILLYNVLFLIVAVGLSFVVGPVAYGISALFSALVMVYYVAKGYRKLDSFPVGLSFTRNQSTRDLWIMVWPIMIGGASIQIYAMLQRFFAGPLGEGAISAVNYASKLTQFPQAILITAVTTVIYPILSKKEAEDDFESIKMLYSKGMYYLTLLLVPVSIFAYFYATNLVQVIFEYGKFDAYSTSITVPVFEVFVLSILFLAVNTYITRFYYAKGDSAAPVVFSILNVFIINIGIMYAFTDDYGATAIAWATLISSVTNTLMLVVYGSYKYGFTLIAVEMKTQWLRPWIPFIIIGVVTYVSSKYFVFDYKWATFIVGLTIFTLTSLVSLHLFGIKEVSGSLQRLRKRFSRSSHHE